MTLKEALEKYKGRSVKIGASTNFFFCGIVDENTADFINTFGEDYFKRAEHNLRKYKADEIPEEKWALKKRQMNMKERFLQQM